MTSITAILKGAERVRATRIDIWRESLGGVGRFEVNLDNKEDLYGGVFSPQDAAELKINGTSMMKGYVDDSQPNVKDPTAVYHNLIKVTGRDYGQDLVNLYLTKKYLDERTDKIFDNALSETGAEITYTPDTDVQETNGTGYSLYTGLRTRVGQKKTISSEKVYRLEFYLLRVGSPTGDVSAVIRKVSDDSVIQSAVICGAAELSTNYAWVGVSFDDPSTINEEVRVLVEFSGGDDSNNVQYGFSSSDVKASECLTYYDGSYTDNTDEDGAYRIYLDYWPELTYEFNRQYLLNGFCDLAKLVDADFYVDDDKALQLFLLSAAPSSDITLKSVPDDPTNNILEIDKGEKIGFDIRNYIEVTAGDVDDHWTEGNASDWTAGTGCTVSNETTMVLAGKASLKIARSDGGIFEFSMPLTILKVGYTSIDMSAEGQAHFLVYHNFNWPYLFKCRPRLTDSSGNVIEYRSDGFGLSRDTTDEPLDGLWNKVVFPVGEICEIKAVSTDKFWSFITGSTFDWSDIVSVLFTSVVSIGGGANLSYYFDGLCLPIAARAIREDAVVSQPAYRKRMIPITRTDVKSQVQLNTIAADELAKRKDPLQKLKVTSTFQSACKYAGQTVVVNAPSSGIDSVIYRILSLHHAAEPYMDLSGGRGHDAITEFELIKHETTQIDPLRMRTTSAWATSQRMDARIRAMERG